MGGSDGTVATDTTIFAGATGVSDPLAGSMTAAARLLTAVLSGVGRW